ncbi:papilin isoform X5 [Equus caballus]|uniref:papilin isoform X5 n=1 Tax=Equus caballus TaxID=9796 RepID=UPI0038B3B8B7
MRLLLFVPLLLAPAPGSSAPQLRQQSDTWGLWGNWSPCSRTCGGGVSFRERPCYSQRGDGGSSCVGPARNHRSCRTESCPEGARDFRAEQCAEFDGREFQGRRYRWLPYYRAPNKCELNCIPEGESFYYKHKEAVVDGTPCEPGKRDVCVEGSCRVVGCDYNLDSSKQEDKCLQCGGDGTTCYPVTGTFEANDLSRGHASGWRPNPFPGAHGPRWLGPTYPVSSHTAATWMPFLALPPLSPPPPSHFGCPSLPLTLTFVKLFPPSGTLFPKQPSPPCVLLAWPFPDPLCAAGHLASSGSSFLWLGWSQSISAPSGYNQILIVPTGATSVLIEEAAASRNFLAVKNIRGQYYLNGHWTVEGARALPVASTFLHYERGAEGDLAPERLHARGPTSEPLVIELISQEPNPGVRYEYYLPWGAPRPGFSWSHGSWSDCSAECDGGHQSRLVFCTFDNEAYPDHMCQHQLRPADRRPCSPHPCPQTKRTSYLYQPRAWCLAEAQRVCGNSWKTGPWAPCSASCGGGSQSRSVYCVSSSGAGVQEAAEEAAEEAECAGLPGKPPATQACNLQRCAAWSAGPWGECSVSCGAGVRRRSVTCQGDEGSLLHATACSLEDQPPLTEPCLHDDCPPINDQAWHVGAWGLVSTGCPPHTCCQSWSLGSLTVLQELQLGHAEASSPLYQGAAWLLQEPAAVQAHGRGALQHAALSSSSGSPQHAGHAQQPQGLLDVFGPLGGPHLRIEKPVVGTPGATLSPGYGCCPDGMSVAEGPHQAGCARSYGGDARNRLGSRAVASTVPKAHWPQAQQNEPSECRGSQFGCCYDNVASAAGPLGEGCVGQPSYAYPVRCLLPSAHGSCTDWAAHWYFIASVGQCNRFWYGGCHGNANNFVSEEECMSSCRRPQLGPHRPEPGASGQSTHRDGGGSSPGGQQEANQHRMEATVQRKPFPSGGRRWQDRQPGQEEAHHTQAFGERPWGQELGPSAPRQGGDAGRPAPPSQSSSYRITLAGSELSPVQVALGQLVRLFCPDDPSLDSQAWWQKDGGPISSDRHKLQPDGSLVISPLRAEDAGTYSCGGTRPGADSQKIQLQITGGDMAVLSEAELRHFPQTRDPAQGRSPQDSSLGGDAEGLGATSSSHPWPTTRLHLDRNQPGVVDAHPGQQIRLICRAEGFPPPAIEWQRDGQPLSSPRHQLQPDGSLVIRHVAVEDGGFYACVAFNGQDRDQRWVRLRVLGELTITGLPSTVTVPEGDTARLLCVVAGENVNIRWSRNGLPVWADGHRVHQSPDGTLLIHNLRARDEGSYTCSAYRGSQAVSRSTEVKVVPPALAAQPRDPSRECIDQPELANCDLILQAQLCGNEYYSSFCCASCSRFQPHAQPIWQQG